MDWKVEEQFISQNTICWISLNSEKYTFLIRIQIPIQLSVGQGQFNSLNQKGS